MYRGVILPIEVDRRVVTGLLPAMRTLLGFTGYTTVDFERGRFGSFTEYRDRAAAEVACSASPGAIRAMVADLIPTPPDSSLASVLYASRLEGHAGYLVHRAYSGCRDVGELARRVNEGPPPGSAAAPGLRGFTLMNMGDGKVVSLTLFDVMGNAETAHDHVEALVDPDAADLLPQRPEVMVGRVLSEIRS